MEIRRKSRVGNILRMIAGITTIFQSISLLVAPSNWFPALTVFTYTSSGLTLTPAPISLFCKSQKNNAVVCCCSEHRISVGVPASYWEHRYRTGDKGPSTDRVDDRGTGWLCEYKGPLQQTLQAVTGGDCNARILNLGCGVDCLSSDVYRDGYANLISTDISPAAIEEMRSRTAEAMPQAQWAVDDAMSMNLKSGSTDVILDKGTLDAILIRPAPFTSAALMLREVHRVLRVGGTYLLVSDGRGDADAQSRLAVLTMPHLSFNIAKTPNFGGYFIFACTKLAEPPTEAAELQWVKAQSLAASQDAAASSP